jgi:hypothetical protein
MLIEATSEIASRITGAIRDAAKATGASFDYLLKTALRESSLNPDAKAPTSSAAGLFQFIDQTWLGTLKQEGTALGYGKYADAIGQSPSGRYVVSDPGQRRAVMALRKDPAAAAAMAGAFTKRNAALLSQKLGRPPTDGELYIAHFLGPTGAVKLISSAQASPNAKAARLFPHASRANRSIFYDQAGGARSLGQVYAALVAKHDNVRATFAVAAATQVGGPGTSAAVSAIGSAQAISAAAAMAPAAPPASDAPAQASDSMAPSSFAAEPGPMFHSLFRTDARTPLSPVVSELWGVNAARPPQTSGRRVAEAAAAAASGPSVGGGSPPLNLLEFLRPDIRAGGKPGA